MPKFNLSYFPAESVWRFSGEIDLEDMSKLRLSRLDRMVLRDPSYKAADCLQSLELIYRNLEQQAEHAKSNERSESIVDNTFGQTDTRILQITGRRLPDAD